MQQIRPPAVAGSFYPGQAPALTTEVRSLLQAAGPGEKGPAPLPKALIAPHAGYIYSGPTAAHAYALLRAARGVVRRVVLLGPVHRVPVHGLALPEADGFATPLGIVPLDHAAMEALSPLPQLVKNAAAHAREHSLEVQLPFLQLTLGEFALVPLAVGDAALAEVAEVLDTLWGGTETLIVVSSDLSHYLPYPAAQRRDAATAQMILEQRGTLTPDQACGSVPVNGLLLAAQRRRLQPQLLDLRNSGDTAGERDRVVGYGAFAFFEEKSGGR